MSSIESSWIHLIIINNALGLLLNTCLVDIVINAKIFTC